MGGGGGGGKLGRSRIEPTVVHLKRCEMNRCPKPKLLSLVGFFIRSEASEASGATITPQMAVPSRFFGQKVRHVKLTPI